jgi:hypothetical protein
VEGSIRAAIGRCDTNGKRAENDAISRKTRTTIQDRWPSTADRVAQALVGDSTVAFHGLLMLTIGYSMLPYVNEEAVRRQAQEVDHDPYSRKAERPLLHPLLMNRLFRCLQAGSK